MIHSAASGAAAFGLFVAVALPAGALENAAARLASAALPPGGACSGALGMSGGGGATKPVDRAIAGKAFAGVGPCISSAAIAAETASSFGVSDSSAVELNHCVKCIAKHDHSHQRKSEQAAAPGETGTSCKC